MHKTVPVRMPEQVWGHLASLADKQGVTVGELIAATVASLVKTSTQPRQSKGGRPSKYTPELGQRILEARWFHRTYAEIAEAEGLSLSTVPRYEARAQAERARAAMEVAGTTTETEAAA